MSVLTMSLAQPLLLFGQDAAVQWTGLEKELTATDKRQILELADRIGVHQVRMVSEELIRLPLGCLALRVQSEVSATGNRRTWSEAFIDREDPTGGHDELGRFCHARPSQATRIGRWEVDWGGVFRREVWRVPDGAWYFDVTLEDGVTYETAANIILAIKRRTFVDRRQHVENTPFGSDLLIGGPAGLRRVGDHYQLRMGTGGGLVLQLVVEGDRVALTAVDTWVS